VHHHRWSSGIKFAPFFSLLSSHVPVKRAQRASGSIACANFRHRRHAARARSLYREVSLLTAAHSLSSCLQGALDLDEKWQLSRDTMNAFIGTPEYGCNPHIGTTCCRKEHTASLLLLALSSLPFPFLCFRRIGHCPRSVYGWAGAGCGIASEIYQAHSYQRLRADCHTVVTFHGRW